MLVISINVFGKNPILLKSYIGIIIVRAEKITGGYEKVGFRIHALNHVSS